MLAFKLLCALGAEAQHADEMKPLGLFPKDVIAVTSCLPPASSGGCCKTILRGEAPLEGD